MHMPIVVQDLQDLVWLRYGLLSVPATYKPPMSVVAKYNVLAKAGKLLTVLGHWKSTLPGEALEVARVFVAFLTYDVAKDQTRESPPPFLADTIRNSPRPPPFQQPRRIEIRVSQIQKKTWYLLYPSQPPQYDVDYVVAVWDPLTVNQLMREGTGASSYQIAAVLLRKGCAFKTLRPYPRSPQLMWPSPAMPMFTESVPLGLGVRDISVGKFTTKDYEQYLDMREEVLRSCDGRAALLAGGIIWRLALDALCDKQITLDGPSLYPTRANYHVFDGLGYVDDVLTEHQEDVICGVYRVLPGALLLQSALIVC